MLVLGLLSVALGITIWAAALRRVPPHRSPQAGPLCATCSYSLAGLPLTTPCPECGSTGRATAPRPRLLLLKAYSLLLLGAAACAGPFLATADFNDYGGWLVLMIVVSLNAAGVLSSAIGLAICRAKTPALTIRLAAGAAIALPVGWYAQLVLSLVFSNELEVAFGSGSHLEAVWAFVNFSQSVVPALAAFTLSRLRRG